MTLSSRLRYVKSSPEVIRRALMLYVRFPPSLREGEYLLDEPGTGMS